MRSGGRPEGDDERARLLDAMLGLGDHVAALGRVRRICGEMTAELVGQPFEAVLVELKG